MIRSAAYRIAIVYSLVFAVATVLLGVGVYVSVDRALRGQFDDRIASEASSLVAEYRGEGLASLTTIIARREEARATADIGYALFAADGRRIAGRLAIPMPPVGWQTLFVADGHEARDPARAYAIRLTGGETLVVASDWDDLERAQHKIVGLFSIGFVAVIGIGAAGAGLLGAYLRRRLSAISSAAEDIISGDLTVRVPVGDRQDEFDRLALVLNVMLDRITTLLESLRQVSSDVAHDLRTPLNRLRNRLEEGLRNPDQAHVIESALAGADEVLALFAAILRLSEIESGKLARDFAAVDLSALVEDIADSYQPAIEDDGRTLGCAIERGVVVAGDAELIAQALINLLDNAQIHTPARTHITIALAREAGAVRLTVTDTGPGVPATDRGRILQRFARLEASRSHPGHGLGLSLVAAIARAHRAELRIADNRPGMAVSMVFAG